MLSFVLKAEDSISRRDEAPVHHKRTEPVANPRFLSPESFSLVSSFLPQAPRHPACGPTSKLLPFHNRGPVAPGSAHPSVPPEFPFILGFFLLPPPPPAARSISPSPAFPLAPAPPRHPTLFSLMWSHAPFFRRRSCLDARLFFCAIHFFDFLFSIFPPFMSLLQRSRSSVPDTSASLEERDLVFRVRTLPLFDQIFGYSLASIFCLPMVTT